MLSSIYHFHLRNIRFKPGLASWGLALLTFLPSVADAQTVSGGASPTTMVNNVCTFILGQFGQSIAVLAIAAVGLALMFGRASLMFFACVIGGIIIMFGSAYLGATLTGS